MENGRIEKIVGEIYNKLNFKMSLAIAKKIASMVEKKAEEMGISVVVAVSDEAARPVLVECMDNAYIASYDIAFNKAYTVTALKMSTAELKKLSQPGKSLYGIQFTNQGKIVIFGGGDPLTVGDKVVGGLGVSGGSEEQDTFLSEYGARCFRDIIKECEK